MPHPGKELTRKDNPSGMDADFKEHLKLFTESILDAENIVSKRIGRAELDGRHLMRFAKMWADKFNNSKLPEVASLFDSTVNIHNAISKKLAMEHFNVQMDDYMKEMPRGMNQYQFDERFNIAIKSAIEILRSLKPMGDKIVVDDLMEELMNDIKSQHKWFLMANEHNAKFLQLEEKYSEKVALIEKSLDNNRKRLAELSAKNNFFSWEEKERIASQMEEYKKQMEELLKNIKMESGQKNKKISDLEKEIQQIRTRRNKRES
jgi:dynactin complex subunit